MNKGRGNMLQVQRNIYKNRNIAIILSLLLFVSALLPLMPVNNVFSAEQNEEEQADQNDEEEQYEGPQGEERIVAYYTNWATYGRNFQVLDIDASNITHILYAFADFCWEGFDNRESPPGRNQCYSYVDKEAMDNGLVVSSDTWADFENESLVRLTEEEKEEWDVDYYGNLGAFRKLKEEYPHLKVLLTLGGWTLSKNFSNVTYDEEARATFVESAVDFVREYDLDGIDIDWEYPVGGGGMEGNSNRPEDKENHTKLLRELREELDKYESKDEKEYELSIASSANPVYLENNEMDQIGEIVDFVNIMTYDFYVANEGMNGHNAPLVADLTADIDGAAIFNVETAVEGHLEAGIPSEKLVMGMPMYGRSWEDCNGEYTECSGPSEGTWEDGVLDYDHILEKMNDAEAGYTRHWNNQAQVPYLLNDEGEFVSFDDVQSIAEKAMLAKELDLGGAMFWELSQDRNQDLITAAVNVFNDIDFNAQLTIDEADFVEIFKGKTATALYKNEAEAFTLSLPIHLPNETKLRADALEFSKSELPKGYKLSGGAFNIEIAYPERHEEFYGEFELAIDVNRGEKDVALYVYDSEMEEWEVVTTEEELRDGMLVANINEMGKYAVFSEDTSSNIAMIVWSIIGSLLLLFIIAALILHLYRRKINADDALLT